MFVGPRSFAAANGVFPDINYFIPPDFKNLTTFILQGKFSLLYGHRQSGKTTMIQALAQHLREISNTVEVPGFPRGLEVYIISFNAGINVENGTGGFWASLCLKMQAGYPDRFPLDGDPCSSSTFQSHFRRADNSRPVVLLFDEGSLLVNRDKSIVNDFIGTLRLLRDGRKEYCMHSLILAGVETVKWLLESQSSISPFTREATITPGYFTVANIKTLLDEYSTEVSIQLDSYTFAWDIYQRTLGHKGLVGTCCAALETIVIPGHHSISIEQWELYAVSELVRYIRGQDTYASIVRSLGDLEENHRNIVVLALRHGSARVKDVRQHIWFLFINLDH